jgi:23S rRNA (adenine2503-C2)-methyltransferase
MSLNLNAPLTVVPSRALPSAFGELPEAFEAAPNDRGHLFERVQRTGTWGAEGPVLGKHGLTYLTERYDLRLPHIVSAQPSADGATKFVLRLQDGQLTECVHMPRDVREPRVTLCISSQVGCGMGCTFCATARMGFVRQLSAAEMVAQVLLMHRELGPKTLGRTSIVFMGMGEPLNNLAAVLHTVRILSHARGLGIAPSRMTLSTSGLVPQIRALGNAPIRPQLAVSLNASTDASRSKIMPVGLKYGLAELRAALLAFPFRPHEKLTLEYVLLAGENDTEDDAVRVADFARGLRHNVNVIPWNGFAEAAFARPSEIATKRFVDVLRRCGAFVTVRASRGQDVAAACGQLTQITQLKSRAKRSKI